ncbi:MAG: hypothetical protein MUQ10_14115 [Anaerolineae bacterium]|nr:hypothetical protein [Anaerolineae bacterium]
MLSDRKPEVPDQAVNASFQKGISFATWWSGQYSEPGSDVSLEILADTGTEWISLIVTAYQDTHASTIIDYRSESTPTDEDLIHAIETAHGLGLSVMLKPHLDLREESTTDYWRGHIGDNFTTESQWQDWFVAYRGFIEHYAELAQQYGVEQFCAGTELLGTTHREADWREVVAGVRAVYSGPVTYASLHGGEEVSIMWWDAVDFIGVDSYYPLNENLALHPTIEELEAGWADAKAILSNLSATHGKQIVLTEIGYRSQHGCSFHPWDSDSVSPLDMEEQANAYEAAFRQLAGESWLGGMFWWTWLADRFESGSCDDGFSPYDKPAERVLRAWYGGTSLVSGKVVLPDYENSLQIYDDSMIAGWEDWSWGIDNEMSSGAQVYSGSQALFVTLDPWGALSFNHAVFSTGQYKWFEFYILTDTSETPALQVFFESPDGVRLPAAPIDDCRHIESSTDTGAWRHVRIPVAVLNPGGNELARVYIQSILPETSVSLWIDDLRFLGAKEATDYLYLPLILAE